MPEEESEALFQYVNREFLLFCATTNKNTITINLQIITLQCDNLQINCNGAFVVHSTKYNKKEGSVV